MKVSINAQFIDGPYGGGVMVAKSLKKYFESKNVRVVNSLHDDDIDVIFHINPFPFLMRSPQYSFVSAYQYKLKHPETIVVAGVHECDERKGTTYMNRLLVRACAFSDAVVFVASWLVPLLEKAKFSKKKFYRVILNGADEDVFNSKEKKWWNHKQPLRLVTHHWSNHILKGHDIYQQIDEKLADPEFASKYAFSYIGNFPNELSYTHSTVVEPLSGKSLADELRKHDVYITASRNEPAGLHHIEGALCGLPVLYIESGGIPEYCKGFGIPFTPETFFQALEKMREEYDEHVAALSRYNKTATQMAEQYYTLAKELVANKETYKDKRSIFVRSLLWLVLHVYDFIFGWYMKLKVKFLTIFSL